MKRLMTALFAAASAALIASSLQTAGPVSGGGRGQLVVELGTPALAQSKITTPTVKSCQTAPFSVFDWGVCGLDEYSSIEDAEAELGTCAERCTGISENDVTCEYAWGSLDFHSSEPGRPPLLRAVTVKSDGIQALRDIQVGDGMDEALARFPDDCERTFEGARVLYCADPFSTTGTPVPPCAVYASRGGFDTLVLAVPTSPLKDGDILCADYYVCRVQAVNRRVTSVSYSIVSGSALADCMKAQ